MLLQAGYVCKYELHVVSCGDPEVSKQLLFKPTNELISIAPDDGLSEYKPLRLLRLYMARPATKKAVALYDSMLKSVKDICEKNDNLSLWVLQFQEGKRVPFQVCIAAWFNHVNICLSALFL